MRYQANATEFGGREGTDGHGVAQKNYPMSLPGTGTEMAAFLFSMLK